MEHQYHLIYHANCTEPSCHTDYVVETGRRIVESRKNLEIVIVERIKYHSGRDHAAHLVKHNIETFHTDVNTANFKIIDINFSNNIKKQKTVESLWIKDLRPTLNVQKKSVPLKFFN